MIKIIVTVDTVDIVGTEELESDSYKLKCSWEKPENASKEETALAGFIISKINDAINIITSTVLLEGGSAKTIEEEKEE